MTADSNEPAVSKTRTSAAIRDAVAAAGMAEELVVEMAVALAAEMVEALEVGMAEEMA